MPAARPPGVDPLFLKIHDAVLFQITSGKIAPGQQLPSVADMAKEWKTTRPTARKAYERLMNGGHITAVPRRGYFVRMVDQVTWNMSAAGDPWATASAGRTVHELTEVRVVAADTLVGRERIGALLGLPPDGDALCRQVLRTIANHPRELASYYLPFDLVKDTPAKSQDLPGGLIALLAELGYQEHAIRDVNSARMPDEQEAARLELDPGTPVMVTTRRSFFTPGDQCLLVRHSVYNPHGAEFIYETTR
ncbi:GntR family transcriptional regulator [Microbispora sp. NPDC049125]|uniref:GntR family transcriptional regulator n=1 Tax=Microbispora sp. NPDC049125 TaxID=3154929 RepID=UPI0034675839